MDKIIEKQKCSRKKCTNDVDNHDKYKRCFKCREKARVSHKKYRDYDKLIEDYMDDKVDDNYVVMKLLSMSLSKKIT